MRYKLFIAAALAALAAPAHAASLTTTYEGGNGQNGIMFNAGIGGNSLTLTSIAVNVETGPFNFEIYYRQGGLEGAFSDPSGWTLLNSYDDVTGEGLGNPTLFDITDLALLANTTYGFYLTTTDTSGPNVEYTNGSTSYSNSDLTIFAGFGREYLFSESFSPRIFNGTFNYNVGVVPEPATWATMIGGFGLIGAAARRRTRTTAIA